MRLVEDQPIFAEHHLTNLQNFFSTPDILSNGLFTTLRHKRWGVVDGGYESFCDSVVENNWKFFLKRLNRYILKSAHTKHGKKLQHISVEHKHPTKLLLNHIHTILVKPAYMSLSSFTEAVIDCWNRTPFGTTGHNHEMFSIRNIYSGGVIKYQFKDSPNYDSYTLGFHIHK